MKSKKYILILTFLVLSILISACSSTAYSSTGWHGLTANGDKAYLAAGTQVYAVDLTTGSENWRYPSKANAKISFYANPALTSDGQLIVPSYDTKLYSLNPATGSENWIFSGSSNRLIAAPLVTEEMIYQTSTDHFIYAVDFKGNLVWKQETGGPIWAQPARLFDCGCIYVASMDHYVYSYDASNGRLLWQSPDLGSALVSTPTVNPDGYLFVGTYGKEMIALNTMNGEVGWRFNTEGRVWSGPALGDGVLYFGDISGYFYALNAVDGTSVWTLQPDKSIVSTPVIVGDNIYVTTEADTLYIISTAGEITSSKVIGGMVYSSPVNAGDTILVAPTNFESLLFALNLDGNQKWTFTPAKK